MDDDTLRYIETQAEWRGKTIAMFETITRDMDKVDSDIKDAHRRVNKVNERVDNLERTVDDKEKELLKKISDFELEYTRKISTLESRLVDKIHKIDLKIVAKYGTIGGVGGVLGSIVVELIIYALEHG